MATAANERTPLLVAPPIEDDPATIDKNAHSDLSDPTKLPVWTRNCILVAVWSGVFLGALDTTIVSTLVSDVSSSFEKSNQAGWLGTSYLLSTATFTPLYGRLCDIMGRRGAALLAASLFTVGTAVCGLAPSMLILIIGRLVAGMGGGGLMAISSIIASDLIPLKKRAFAQGLANIFYGCGAGLGGPVGGLVADWLGWRSAFLLQLPLLGISITMVFMFVKYTLPGQGKSKMEMIKRIDYAGSFSLVMSLGSLLLALSFKNNDSMAWSDPLVWGNMTVFVVFLGVFVLVEAFWSPEPVMPLRILRDRNGVFVALINFLLSSVSFSVLFFYPMWFEIVMQKSASESGAHLLPNSVALSIGSLFAGYMIRHTGKYYWLIAISSLLPIVALGALSMLGRNSAPWLQWLGVIPSGFGFSAVVTSVLIAMIASVPRGDMAVATGLTYLFRYVGQVFGVALSSALLQAILTSELSQRITGPGSAEIIEKIRTVATSIPTLDPELQEAAIASYSIGLRAVFLLNMGLSVLCFLSTVPLREYPLPGSFEEEAKYEEERRRGREARGARED